MNRGAGYEKVDLDAARSRGIAVTNASGLNANAVAEHAMALLLAIARQVPRDDAAIHRGAWREYNELPPRHGIHGKRVGILGLGAIGAQVAIRALSFGAAIGYHNRNRLDDLPYTYFGTAEELASESDILVVCCPGGPATRKL